MPKFTRYLFAARGVRLLPDAFNKCAIFKFLQQFSLSFRYDYACARSEASSRYNIRDIADGVGKSLRIVYEIVEFTFSGVTNIEERYNISYDEVITRLRRLHTAICGSTLIGGVINLI